MNVLDAAIGAPAHHIPLGGLFARPIGLYLSGTDPLEEPVGRLYQSTGLAVGHPIDHGADPE